MTSLDSLRSAQSPASTGDSQLSYQSDNQRTAPEVDVLLVSYNAATELAGCVRSLERTFSHSLYDRVGVRILDNGSSDGAASVIEHSFPRVLLTKSPTNLLYGPGVNILARQSKATYLLLLNPDTVIVSDIIAPMIEVLRHLDSVALAFPDLTYPSGEQQPSSQSFPTLGFELAMLAAGSKLAKALRFVWDADDIVRRAFMPPPRSQAFPMRFIWSTCCMMRREEAVTLGPFDERYPMYDTDLDLCRRLANMGRTAVFIPDHRVVHIGGASSSPQQRARMMAEGRRRYYRDHGTRWEVLLFPLVQKMHQLIRQRHTLAERARRWR